MELHRHHHRHYHMNEKFKILDAKVIKKSKPGEGEGAGNTNKTANGTCVDAKGAKKDCPIDNDHVIKGQPLYRNFKLNVTIPD